MQIGMWKPQEKEGREGVLERRGSSLRCHAAAPWAPVVSHMTFVPNQTTSYRQRGRGGLEEWQPGLLRLTHTPPNSPPTSENFFLGKQKNVSKGPEIGGQFYCLRQGTSKRGEGQPFLSCRGWKTA